MNTVIPLPASVLLPVLGTPATYPVRRVYCVGRNYADHAVEMGHDPTREQPFFFQKNPENLVLPDGGFPYPAETSDVHHEVELVVALKAGGSSLSLEQASSCVFGYAVGIDFTRRDLQARAKADSRPWTAAKAFEHSAPVSPIIAAKDVSDPGRARIWLSVNSAVRQDGHLSQMIWRVPEIICELSRFFTLAAGDVIMTGTPAGVGPVSRGDRVACGIDGIGTLDVLVI